MATTETAVARESLLMQGTAELEVTLEEQDSDSEEERGGRRSLSRARRSWERERNVNEERTEGTSKNRDDWLTDPGSGGETPQPPELKERNGVKTSQISGRSEKSLKILPKPRQILLDSRKTKHLSEVKQVVNHLADDGFLTRVDAVWKRETLPEEPDQRQQRETLKDDFVYEREVDANQDGEKGEGGNGKGKRVDQMCLQQGGSRGCDKRYIQEQDGSEVKFGQRREGVGCCSPLGVAKGGCVGERSFKCWHCDQIFHSSVDLLVHERIHMGEKLYSCFRCGVRIRVEAGQNYYDCLQCGSSFGRDRDEDYTCSECGKSFTARLALHGHQNKHKSKLYICTLCGELIRGWSYFTVHLAGHGVEDPAKL